MDGHPPTSTACLEWENLALYTAKPLHFPISVPSLLANDLYHVPTSSEDIAHPAVGLRLGRHKEYRDVFASPPPPAASSIPVLPTPMKRSRASYHNIQNPCCQVEGCNLDLKLAKDYHRRHRICETHSKSPKVVVAGMERRFCQQCSRFHDLSEFDDKKRSCRRRLSDHNARRRRVQPESIQLSSSFGIPPALYTDERHQNVLLNGLPVPLSNLSWENSNSGMPKHAKARDLNEDDVMHMDPEMFHRSTPRILDQCVHHVANTNNSSMGVSAHSLLSPNSWSLNEGEPSASIEGIVQGSYSSEPDSHHLTLFQTNNIGLDQTSAASLLHSSHHPFKSPYHSTNFYPTQRSL